VICPTCHRHLETHRVTGVAGRYTVQCDDPHLRPPPDWPPAEQIDGLMRSLTAYLGDDDQPIVKTPPEQPSLLDAGSTPQVMTDTTKGMGICDD